MVICCGIRWMLHRKSGSIVWWPSGSWRKWRSSARRQPRNGLAVLAAGRCSIGSGRSARWSRRCGVDPIWSQTAARKSLAWKQDRAHLLTQEGMSVLALRLFELLPRRPIVTVASVMRFVEGTEPTAGRAIELLVAAGVLVETTGRKRDRSFVYRELPGSTPHRHRPRRRTATQDVAPRPRGRPR